MTRTSMLAVLFMSLAACRSPAPAAESPRPGGLAEQAAAQRSGPKLVSKVLFVDLTDPCQCTKTRQEKTWNELMQGIKGTDIVVERVHWDTEGERAEAYAEKKPFTVIPALYFLDAEGDLIDMLQGEITRSQFESMISGSATQTCSPGLDCPDE